MSETTFATALDTLGQILPSDPGRDAIHLATYVVAAGEKLFPGQHIGVMDGDKLQAFSTAEKLIGIVDPFLAGPVFPGQMFWLVLYPRTITSLRHVWSHPDFAVEKPVMAKLADDREASEAWLRKWVEHNDCPDYDTLIAALKGEWPPTGTDADVDGYPDYYNFQWGGWDDESLHFGGKDAHSDIPPEFWDHISVVLGRTIEPEKRAKHFSCSC